MQPPIPPSRWSCRALAPHPVRPFYWSVRRELWENRSLFIAPLVAGGVIVLAVVLALIGNAAHLSDGVRMLTRCRRTGSTAPYPGCTSRLPWRSRW